MNKVLIANRGEIACRIIRSCRALDLVTVAVYSEADATALHVTLADEAYPVGPAPARESYLAAEKLLEVARTSGADAVHPGYGFLAENARFAEAVGEAGLIWIGPRPQTIADMGDKERARDIAAACGVPVLPGSPRFGVDDLAGIQEAATAVGYPLIVKAAAGGGGIGMRRVAAPDKLHDAVAATQSMAGKAFADGTVYLERWLPAARHVEVQVFGFADGHAVHLHERECSIQRRFQKVVEETPAPGLPDTVRRQIASAACAICRHERYAGAGTVEFIVDARTFEFYFLEMNTRIQVEHPITEMVTGRDLVAMQIDLARGALVPFAQHEVTRDGHAIECRLYAENPSKRFLPSPGTLRRFELPAPSDSVRIDCGYRTGDEITVFYDPMVAKVVTHARDRSGAIERMLEALRATRIEGIANNVDFLARTVDHPGFRAGEISTRFVDEHAGELIGA